MTAPTAMVERGEKAVELFTQGYNCAQSTAAAFAGDSGLGLDVLLNLAAGFGGGIGGSRETCGAVSGMVLVLGLFHGGYYPHDHEAKTALYRKVREAVEEFRAEFGTTCCRDLLLKAGCLPKPDPSVRDAAYYSTRPCAHFVAKAATIASSKITSSQRS